MEGPLTHLGQQAQPVRRRPGFTPGRRFALALALAFASLGCSAGVAAADSAVVTATIYPGSGGSVSTPSVTLATLNGCQLYSGAGTSPMSLYPGGGGYQPAAGSSWALSTVLQCGLKIPLSDVTSVQVNNGSRFETSLSGAELTDPSYFHDPAAPEALPVISSDGSENPPQISYTRPYLGGSDDNAADQVVGTSPIAVVVYENGPPLQVTASSSLASHTATTMSVNFSATVQSADGTPLSASALAWNWSFGDGASSTQASPSHPYAIGAYTATVQVTDTASGTGGTDTITVSAPAGSSGTPHNGGGKHSKGKASTGAEADHGKKPGATARRHKANKSGASNRGQGTAGGTAGTSGTAGTGGTAGTSGSADDTAPTNTATPNNVAPSGSPPAPAPAPAPAASIRPKTAPHPARPVPRAARPAVPTGPPARLVTGQLISDVTPLPAAASPLVRPVAAPPATAPAVRSAVAGSPVPAIGAGVAVLALLGLGAGRELRWRRGWRWLGAGS